MTLFLGLAKKLDASELKYQYLIPINYEPGTIYKPTNLLYVSTSVLPETRNLSQHSIRATQTISEEALRQRAYSKDEVRGLIELYSKEYSIGSDIPLRIADCESHYRWDAKNPISTASGVFQYLAGTWANTPVGKQGISVFDAEANVHMAIASIATTGTAPWNSSKEICWNK